MDTNAIVIAFGLMLFGAILTSTGIKVRFNGNKAWYLIPNYYVLLPRGAYYAMPLIGVMTFLAGISLFMPTPELVRKVWLFGVFPTGFLSVLVVVFQPKWLKPTWVRWLEENHMDILNVLIEDARKTPDWAKRVNTQEGLETWVEEVKRKRGIK